MGGHDVTYLLSLGHNVTCVDASAVALSKYAKLNPNATFIQGDVVTMKLANFRSRFDFIFMRSVLYHIEGKRGVLKRICMWLKLDGIFLDVEYDPDQNAKLA